MSDPSPPAPTPVAPPPACDRCGRPYLPANECLACGREVCLDCVGWIGGAVVRPTVCADCAVDPRVRAVCRRHAARLQAAVAARDAALRALRGRPKPPSP